MKTQMALVLVIFSMFSAPVRGESEDRTKFLTENIDDFYHLLKGHWEEIPIPDSVALETCDYAWEFLSRTANPCKSGIVVDRKFCLGLHESPDKLVTLVRDKSSGDEFLLIETVSQYCVKFKGFEKVQKEKAYILNQLLTKTAIFSEKIASFLISHIKDSISAHSLYNKDNFPKSKSALLLSSRSTSPFAELHDGIKLFWYCDEVYVCLPKHAGSNLLIHLWQDWFTFEIREQRHLPQRNSR